MTKKAKRGAVQPASAVRRRTYQAVARANRVTARYSDEEYAAVLAYAAAARLAAAAYVAEASLRPSAWRVGMSSPDGGVVDQAPESAVEGVPGPVLDEMPSAAELRRMELLELMGMHRQLRGACTNLNQAVAKLNALGEPVGELAAVAEYVRRVTTSVDAVVAAVRMRR